MDGDSPIIPALPGLEIKEHLGRLNDVDKSESSPPTQGPGSFGSVALTSPESEGMPGGLAGSPLIATFHFASGSAARSALGGSGPSTPAFAPAKSPPQGDASSSSSSSLPASHAKKSSASTAGHATSHASSPALTASSPPKERGKNAPPRSKAEPVGGDGGDDDGTSAGQMKHHIRVPQPLLTEVFSPAEYELANRLGSQTLAARARGSQSLVAVGSAQDFVCSPCTWHAFITISMNKERPKIRNHATLERGGLIISFGGLVNGEAMTSEEPLLWIYNTNCFTIYPIPRRSHMSIERQRAKPLERLAKRSENLYFALYGESRSGAAGGEANGADVAGQQRSGSQSELEQEPPPLRSHTLTPINSRYALLFGGGSGNLYSKQLYCLEYERFVWTIIRHKGKERPPGRRAHSAVYYNNSMWVFGGGNGSNALNDLWRLHIPVAFVNGQIDVRSAVFSWEKVNTVGMVPRPRGYHTATVSGNCMVVYGGSDGVTCFGELHILDLDCLRWHTVDLQPRIPRFGHTATLFGCLLVVIGGISTEQYESSVHILNLKTLQWIMPDALAGCVVKPQPRAYHTAVRSQSMIVVWGGSSGDNVQYDDIWALEMGMLSYYSHVKSFRIPLTP